MSSASHAFQTLSLTDDHGPYDALFHPGVAGRSLVLFAVGSGGDPRRHQGLLAALADAGHAVIAPCFERRVGARVAPGELDQRCTRLAAAACAVFQPGMAMVGVGHSIGGTALLLLAGARGWLGPAQPMPPLAMAEVAPRHQAPPGLSGLALMAPPTAFFRAPDALSGVTCEALLLAGERDHIVPHSDVAFAAKQLPTAELVVEPGADHFAFMDARPPSMPAGHPDRAAWVQRLHTTCAAFATRVMR